jgi:hypothetical protein
MVGGGDGRRVSVSHEPSFVDPDGTAVVVADLCQGAWETRSTVLPARPKDSLR